MFLSHVSRLYKLLGEGKLAGCDEQVDGHTPSPEVVHAQNTADNISSQIIKDQNLPYRVSVLVEYRGGM